MNIAVSTSTLARRRWRRRILLTGGLAASLATAYAFKTLFARPGEAALRYVPADAVMIATLDLSPSVSQTLVFKKIDDALKRTGLDQMLDGAATGIVSSSQAAEAIKPYTTRAAAFAIIPGEKKGDVNDQCMLLFIGLTDGKQVSDILNSQGRPEFYRGSKIYRLGKGSPAVMVVDDLLVVSPNPANLARVKQIQDGGSQSVLTIAGFREARGRVEEDANVMCFFAPGFLDAVSGHGPNPKALTAHKWMAAGLAIRDGGLALSLHGDFDTSKLQGWDALASTAPLRKDLFQVMPAGAYGMVTVSQPSKIFQVVLKGMADDKDGKKGVDEMEKGLRDNADLDLQKDVIPAFEGDAVIAAYPSQQSPAAGADVLAMIDDSNGAKPGDLAAKVEKAIEKAWKDSSKQNTGQLFTTSNYQGTTVYRLNAKDEADLRKSVKIDSREVKGDVLTGNKTAIFAVVDKTILIASSEQLLDRALDSYRTRQGGLVTDPKFGPAEARLINGSKMMMAFSVSRIAEGVASTLNIDKMDKEPAHMTNQMLDIFKNLNEPLSFRMVYGEHDAQADLFIPIDYDKVFDLVGEQMQKNKH